MSSLSADESLIESDDDWLMDVCIDFSNRLRAGESPSIAEYTAMYPDEAEKIRQYLTSLDVMRTGLQGLQENLQPPERVADCQIVRMIGAGGMSTVYEAVHPTISRRLAIKVIRHGSSGRFLREAEAASQLIHSNIVPFVDCGTAWDKGYTWISMHLIDGESLDKLQKAHRAPEPIQNSETSISDPEFDATKSFPKNVIGKNFQRIAEIGVEVASALSYAHTRGIVHRDIKPGNLILDRNGKIWVTDFGLAKFQVRLDDESLTKDLVGTPRYMAPEQVRGNSTAMSDVYSLGVTLYELAAGQRAWQGIADDQLTSECATLELPHLSHANPSVPRSLADIIMRACAADPDRRFQTADEFRQALQYFVTYGSSPVSDRFFRIVCSARKNLIWLLASAACLLATIAWWNQPQPREETDLLYHFLTSLPSSPQDANSSEKRLAREKISSAVSEVLRDVVGKDVLPDEAYADIRKAFDDGELTQTVLTDTLEVIANPNLTTIREFCRRVQNSDLPAIERADFLKLIANHFGNFEPSAEREGLAEQLIPVVRNVLIMPPYEVTNDELRDAVQAIQPVLRRAQLLTNPH